MRVILVATLLACVLSAHALADVQITKMNDGGVEIPTECYSVKLDSVGCLYSIQTGGVEIQRAVFKLPFRSRISRAHGTGMDADSQINWLAGFRLPAAIEVRQLPQHVEIVTSAACWHSSV